MATFKKTAKKSSNQHAAHLEASLKAPGSERMLELCLVIICGGLFVVFTFFS